MRAVVMAATRTCQGKATWWEWGSSRNQENAKSHAICKDLRSAGSRLETALMTSL